MSIAVLNSCILFHFQTDSTCSFIVVIINYYFRIFLLKLKRKDMIEIQKVNLLFISWGNYNLMIEMIINWHNILMNFHLLGVRFNRQPIYGE